MSGAHATRPTASGRTGYSTSTWVQGELIHTVQLTLVASPSPVIGARLRSDLRQPARAAASRKFLHRIIIAMSRCFTRLSFLSDVKSGSRARLIHDHLLIPRVTGQLSAASSAIPRLSVVIFVKNAAATIERALTSVFEQPDSLVELLVLDGGSTDGTLDIIRRHEAKIAYWRSFPDGGPEYAMKEGTERASGDVVCLLPADDWLEPSALDQVAREFAADPDLDVLSCGVRIVHYEEGDKLVVDAEFLDPKDLEFKISNIVHGVLSGGRFIRRRIYRQIGGYNPDYSMSNDLEFLIRVCLMRPRAKVLPRLVYTYCRHPASRTLGGDPDMVMAMMRGNIRVSAHHLAHSPLLPGERRELRGFHGRCCARLAWMSMVRGKPAEAVSVLCQAVAQNWLWPIQVVYWFFRYTLKSKPLM